MKTNKSVTIIALVILAIVVISSAYIVNPAEQVIITQFGKPVGKAVTIAGLHFKIPIIQEAHFFDKRALEWYGYPTQVSTKDKRFVWIDTYAIWKITNPLLFFKRVKNERGAQSRLDDILDGQTRNAVADHKLVELIRSTNRDIKNSEAFTNSPIATLPNISYGRKQITRSIVAIANKRTQRLGMTVLDLQFKRINYVESVRKTIFQRMITRREQIADKFKSEGAGEAAKILGSKDRELKKINSEAYKTAQQIKGVADAEATLIYAKAYNKNSDSRKFYKFLKTMETYKKSISKNDWLMLSADSGIYKLLSKDGNE